MRHDTSLVYRLLLGKFPIPNIFKKVYDSMTILWHCKWSCDGLWKQLSLAQKYLYEQSKNNKVTELNCRISFNYPQSSAAIRGWESLSSNRTLKSWIRRTSFFLFQSENHVLKNLKRKKESLPNRKKPPAIIV